MIKKYGMYVLMGFLIFTASVMIYNKLNPKELPNNLIAASGNMNGDLIALNTKYPGRITQINVKDGQEIQQNDVVAILQSKEYKAKLNALNKNIQSAIANIKAMQDEFALTKKTVFINIKKAKQSIDVTLLQKRVLQNEINSLAALVEQNKKDYERAENLYKQNLIAKQKFEYSQLKFTTNQDKLNALQTKLEQADKAIEITQNNYKLSKAQQNKITAFKAKITAAKEQIKALEANADEIRIVIEQLTIQSPINGHIIERISQKGEVLGTGMVIATLLDPKTLYLKVFVDTINNGKIKLGDKAVIFLDAYPNKPIAATVVNIAAKAEFTPKEVSVKSDRIQRVYAVHIAPLHVNPLLKLGIPAIGVISIDGKGLPTSLNDIPVI